MPSDVKAAYNCAVDELALLHSGARLAAKLNARSSSTATNSITPGKCRSTIDIYITKLSRHSSRQVLRCLPGSNQRGETRTDRRCCQETPVASCKSSSAKTLRLHVTLCGMDSTSMLVSQPPMGDPPSQLSDRRQTDQFHLIDIDCLPRSTRSKIRTLRQRSIHLSLPNR